MTATTSKEKSNFYSRETLQKVGLVFGKRMGGNGQMEYFRLADEGLSPVHEETVLSKAGVYEGDYLHDYWFPTCAERNAFRRSIPTIEKMDYQPERKRRIVIDADTNSFVLNLWKPSGVGIREEVTECPELFQEYMERLFSNPKEREYMVHWIARTVHSPRENLRIIPLLRSEHGTGKGYLLDTVLSELVGRHNYTKTTMSRCVGRFNSQMGESTLVFIDELYSDKKKNSDALKTLVSDDFITIEPKFEKPRTQQIFTNLIAASNSETPVYIESEVDRRWFVPEFGYHKVDKAETGRFIKKFDDWFTDGGKEQLFAYLHHVNKNSQIDFSTAMDTASKESISYEDVKDDAVTDLEHKLKLVRRVKFTAITKEFPNLNQPEIRQILSENGFWKKDNDWNDLNSKSGKRSVWWRRQESDHLFKKGIDWTEHTPELDFE
ncbi:hypothetical protein VSAK1_26285 [Vibrio mediterranei AK1]|uniref:primase-helicase family protein n=1 Tax=Vibrio mediterranei TaxID=689 RepID=UPI0001541423|nr:primase-helicase family protein [Vibrio mediterranei]EDL53751.1 hypothetical protein VSAK1_26285 [Vibrio mediterranei AK1]